MPKSYQSFKFKQFEINHDKAAFKVGTDGVLLGAWANINNANNILDIGTGTGLIAIMCAQRNNIAEIKGVEIDEISAQQAIQNCNNSLWSNRLSIENISLQNFETDILFNHIISNPPYFIGGTKSNNSYKATTRHTDFLPLDLLANKVKNLLDVNGSASFILPVTEAMFFISECEKQQLHLSRICEVKPLKNKAIERLLIEVGHNKTKVEKTNLIIQHQGRNNYTEDYKALTKDFYTIF